MVKNFIVRHAYLSITELWHLSAKNDSVHLVTPLNWKLIVHIIATLDKISLTLNIS